MKKLLLFLGCISLCANLSAQTNSAIGKANVKLSDVIADYKRMHPGYGNGGNGILKTILPGLPKESREKYAQFDRWVWYWKQHVDINGYLVSPAKALTELQKLQTQEKAHRAERTTSGVAAAWVFIGPDSSEAFGEGVGRINLVSFHPTDSNIFWVGTPGGGAWQTKDNGSTWINMTNQLPLLGIGGITFNPLNPSTVYLCTGDRDAGDYPGIGVMKSYDGGATWNTTGMTWPPSMYNTANYMLVNPLDTNSLILATSAGMYRSFDGGATFNQVDTGNFKQVLYRPNDTSIVYATSYINYNYYPTVITAQIYRSADGGTTWTQQTNIGTADRLTLAVTPAAPNMVLAIGSAYDVTGANSDGLDSIYKSSDTGNSFKSIYTGNCSGGNLLTWDVAGSGCGGQGWYTLPLAISPLDSNVVYTGGVNTWGSSDGGHTWNLVNEESPDVPGFPVIHADKHWLAFNPLSPNRLFETNDGGIYSSYSASGTSTWNNHTNRMGIEEIYKTSVSNIVHFAITGAQDDGTKIIRQNGVFEEADGGDGMACLLDYADSTVGYGSSEYGYIDILDPTAAPLSLQQMISPVTYWAEVLKGPDHGSHHLF